MDSCGILLQNDNTAYFMGKKNSTYMHMRECLNSIAMCDFFLIHMSHEGGTKYKEGKGGFEPMTYRSQHLNLNH